MTRTRRLSSLSEFNSAIVQRSDLPCSFAGHRAFDGTWSCFSTPLMCSAATGSCRAHGRLSLFRSLADAASTRRARGAKCWRTTSVPAVCCLSTQRAKTLAARLLTRERTLRWLLTLFRAAARTRSSSQLSEPRLQLKMGRQMRKKKQRCFALPSRIRRCSKR